MTAGQCGASNDRHRVGDEGKPSQMLGGSGGDGGGNPAAPREEGLCPLALEREEEICWHQMSHGAKAGECENATLRYWLGSYKELKSVRA